MLRLAPSVSLVSHVNSRKRTVMVEEMELKRAQHTEL